MVIDTTRELQICALGALIAILQKVILNILQAIKTAVDNSNVLNSSFFVFELSCYVQYPNVYVNSGEGVSYPDSNLYWRYVHVRQSEW